MINNIYHGNEMVYGYKHYVVDAANEVSKLPTTCAIGSRATVIATGDTYILNSKKIWVKQAAVAGGGSGSGGSGDGEGDIVIIDDSNVDRKEDDIVIL